MTKDNGKTALCVQASMYLKYLGNLSVTFDRHGDVAQWEGNPIFLASSIPKGVVYNIYRIYTYKF